MTNIPENLKNDQLTKYLVESGLELLSQGKVRNTFYLDDDRLLVVASDRTSIFDFVLNTLVPRKGEVLTAMTHFWTNTVLAKFNHHLIGSESIPGYNAAFDLYSDFPKLPIERCLVVKNFSGQVYPFEMIYRAHLGGSVWKTYLKTGVVGGHVLPTGLTKWSKLESPLFTPSTKEEVGHDINVDANYFFEQMAAAGLGEEARRIAETLAQAYALAYTFAAGKGILILDTKFEVAGENIIDEILTPDSSRFAVVEDWEEAVKTGRDPNFHDKQPVRDWGEKVPTPFINDDGEKIIGIKKLSPENPEHVAFVHSLEVPEEIIAGTTARYLGIFKMLTGWDLDDYLNSEMGIDVN